MAEDVRTTISRSVRSSCSNNEDVTLAFDFFDEYCAMNEGTTTFAKPENPPGDSESRVVLRAHIDAYMETVSYYITALPQYKSLNKCAQSALSSVVMSVS